MSIGDYLQSADWETEKHVAVIESPERVNAREDFIVSLTIGKEIPHPNPTEHHIEWIELYFLPENGKFPFMVGKFNFSSHGVSLKGANEGPIYTEPKVSVAVKNQGFWLIGGYVIL